MTLDIILTVEDNRSSSEIRPHKRKFLVHPIYDDDDDDERTKDCNPAWSKVTKNITVEPTILLHVVMVLFITQTSYNLSLRKACRVSLNFTEEVCQSFKLQTINNDNKHEKHMQELFPLQKYISTTIQCLILLIAGSYTDKTGRRKIFMIIPIIGQILVCISNILQGHFFEDLSLEFLVYSETLLDAFSGGWCLMLFSCYSYISYVTSEEKRAFRMGLVNIALLIGLPIGVGLRDYFIKNYGYFGGYGVALAMGSINIVYNAVYLKEPIRGFEQRKVRVNKCRLINKICCSILL